MRAEKVVAAVLSADAGVTALVGSKIFFCVAEERTAAPLIVYRKQGATRAKRGVSPVKWEVEALIDVLCVAKTGDQLLAIGEAVRAALSTVSGDNVASTGVKVLLLEVDSESEQQYSPDLREFSQVWTFRVQHIEP